MLLLFFSLLLAWTVSQPRAPLPPHTVVSSFASQVRVVGVPQVRSDVSALVLVPEATDLRWVNVSDAAGPSDYNRKLHHAAKFTAPGNMPGTAETLHFHGFDFFASVPANSEIVSIGVRLYRRRSSNLVNANRDRWSSKFEWTWSAVGSIAAISPSFVLNEETEPSWSFAEFVSGVNDASPVVPSSTSMLHDCRFGGFLRVTADNSVIEVDAVSVTVGFIAPAVVPTPPPPPPPPPMAGEFEFRDIELRPTQLFKQFPVFVQERNTDRITSVWFERASSNGDLALALHEAYATRSGPQKVFWGTQGFTMSDDRLSAPLVLGSFVPVRDEDAPFWPPPAGAAVTGATLSFNRGISSASEFAKSVSDDVSRISLSWLNGSSRTITPLSLRGACVRDNLKWWGSGQSVRADYGSLDASSPEAFRSLSDVRFSGRRSSGGCDDLLRLTLGLKFEGPQRNAWIPVAVSAVRLRLRLRLPVQLRGELPARPQHVLELPATVRSGSFVSGDRFHALLAREDASLAMPISARDLQPSAEAAITLSGFGFARLPRAATVRQLTVSVEHALFNSFKCGDSAIHYACFDQIEWTSVELLVDGVTVSQAFDVLGCGSLRSWPMDHCRAKGDCLGRSQFSFWRNASVALSTAALSSSSFAVRLSFRRTRFSMSDIASTVVEQTNRQDADLEVAPTNGAHPAWAGMFTPSSTFLAAIGRVGVAVAYDEPARDLSRFATPWMPGTITAVDGAFDIDAARSRVSIRDDLVNVTARFAEVAVAVPRDATLLGLRVRWRRQVRCSRFPVTPPPTPAPTPAPPAPKNMTEMPLVNVRYVPVIEFLKSRSVDLVCAQQNSFSDKKRCDYSDVSRATALCGDVVDGAYMFAGSIADERGAFSGGSRPWPADFRAPSRPFEVGGSDYPWTRENRSTDVLLALPEFNLIARRVRQAFQFQLGVGPPNVATAAINTFELSAVFASPGLVANAPDACFLRLRADGTSRARLNNAAWPATSGSLSLWFRFVTPPAAGSATTLVAFRHTTRIDAFALQATGDAVQLQVFNRTSNATFGLLTVPLVSAGGGDRFGAIAGDFVPVHLSWQNEPRTLCLIVGAPTVEVQACFNSTGSTLDAELTLSALGSDVFVGALSGTVSLGAHVVAPTNSSAAASFQAVDIDVFAVHSVPSDRVRRAREWIDVRAASDVAILHSFVEPTGSCTCGVERIASQGTVTKSGSQFEIEHVDCNDATCASAKLLNLGDTVEASVDRLRAADAASALRELTDAVQLCVDADEPVVQPAALAHWFSVRGSDAGGEWLTASTCSDTQVDTRLLILQSSAGACGQFECVAHNDDAVRGRAVCANGGSEVSWRVGRGVTYRVVVIAKNATASDAAVRSRRSFSLRVSACDRFACGFARSCEPCAWASQSDTPRRVSLKSARVNVIAEERCVDSECGGSSTLQLAGVKQLETRLSTVPPRDTAKQHTVLRSNVRVSLRALAVAPAVLVEPDFGAAFGNDNEAFTASRVWPGFTRQEAEAIVRDVCRNPVPNAYRVAMHTEALKSVALPTNVTCKVRSGDEDDDDDINDGGANATISVLNGVCDEELYRVSRVRCDASVVPPVPAALRGDPTRTYSICRPDAELAVLRRLLKADPSLEALLELADDEPSAVDCNFPPVSLDSLESNCTATFQKGGLAASLRRVADQIASGDASDSLDAAKCDLKRRELEARRKVVVALNPFDCSQCSTGGGVAVLLEPVFNGTNFVSCFLERRAATELLAAVVVEVDDRTVLNETLRISTAGALTARGRRLTFARIELAADEADPPKRVVLARNRFGGLQQSGVSDEFVPFLTSSRSWLNDSCLYEPLSLNEFTTAPEPIRGAYARVSDDAQAREIASALAAGGGLLGTGLPRNASSVWHVAPSPAAGGVRRARVVFDLGGSLVSSLAPQGKIDESSVVASLRVDSSGVDGAETVTVRVAGRLVNDFNISGAAYAFSLAVRDEQARVFGRWDVLQVESDRFEIEIALEFERVGAANASMTMMMAAAMSMQMSASTVGAVEGASPGARYVGKYLVEFSDALATFAVAANVEDTDVALYEAEQKQVKSEIDARLVPLIVLVVAVPVLGASLICVGVALQRKNPIPDEDAALHRRHMVVIVAYVLLRVVRSLLLTLTVFGLIWTSVVRAPLATLEEFPLWLDSVSNTSSLIVARSDVALNVELARQQNLSTTQQTSCSLLLSQQQDRMRQLRADIERQHATLKDSKDIVGLQQQNAQQQDAIRESSGAQTQVLIEQQQCWVGFSGRIRKISTDFSLAQFNLIDVKFREVDLKFGNMKRLQIDPFKINFDSYVLGVRSFTAKAIDLTADFQNFLGGIGKALKFAGISTPSFDLLPEVPNPPVFPELDFSMPSPLKEWKLDFALPRAPCLGDSEEVSLEGVGDATQPARNFTAFAPAEEARQDDAVPVPLPNISLRSFVSLPTFLNLFGFLPNLAGLLSFTVIIDILLIVFTHIKTIQGVVELVHGFRLDDKLDEGMGDGDDDESQVRKSCGGGCMAACCACLYRLADRCNFLLTNYRSLAFRIAIYTSQVFSATLAVVLFVLGVWLLVQLVAAVLTVQGFDGLGVFSLISSPVTIALGQANVRAIENARQLNQQTLPANLASFSSAQQEIADLVNEFNDGQQRDLALFNAEYCDLVRRTSRGQVQCDGVVQLYVDFTALKCPHYVPIVPQLFADVDREQFRLIVRSTLTPFIEALRILITDTIWLACAVIVAVLCLVLFSSLLYRGLAWARMIRRRKRFIFESEKQLKNHALKVIDGAAKTAEHTSSAAAADEHAVAQAVDEHTAARAAELADEHAIARADFGTASKSRSRRAQRATGDDGAEMLPLRKKKSSRRAPPPNAPPAPPAPPATLARSSSSRRRNDRNAIDSPTAPALTITDDLQYAKWGDLD